MEPKAAAAIVQVLGQMAVVDIIFSLDSGDYCCRAWPDTAGHGAGHYYCRGRHDGGCRSIGIFVHAHPSIKMLA